jgi:hypothetical protein
MKKLSNIQINQIEGYNLHLINGTMSIEEYTCAMQFYIKWM